MKEDKKAQISLITAMVIFGTIGLFRRYIPLPSSVLALARAVIGTIFLLAFLKVRGTSLDLPAIKKNLPILGISAVAMAFNWILLFEAYRFTTVAVATVCYYMSPVIVLLASPLVLREKLTKKQIVCVLAAFAGLVLISGVTGSGEAGTDGLRGVLLGLGAAVLYASVILLNKKLKDIGPYDRTVVQLLVAAIAILPYVLLTEDLTALPLDGLSIVMLFVVGVVHTGVSYVLYFGSLGNLPTGKVALFSYLDPVVAILLSALFLREPFGLVELAGTVLVLGAAFVSER